MSTIRPPDSGVHQLPPITPHISPERVTGASLPLPLTTFIGREREIAEIGRLLCRDDVRLLSVVGPGGVGKTRLAIEVAAKTSERFADGIVFVSLAPIRDPSLVADAILHALGIPDGRDQPTEVRLEVALRNRHALLVLDNFEQVSAAAALVARLLAVCLRLRVLATGRSRLRISGEHVYAVPPLGAPPDRPQQRATGIASHEAVRLFVQRTREEVNWHGAPTCSATTS